MNGRDHHMTRQAGLSAYFRCFPIANLAHDEIVRGQPFEEVERKYVGDPARRQKGPELDWMSAAQLGDDMTEDLLVRALRSAGAEGVTSVLSRDSLGFSYRSSVLKGDRRSLVTRVWLRVERCPPDQACARIDGYMERRRATQPIAASAGCVFQNPLGVLRRFRRFSCPSGLCVSRFITSRSL